MKKILFFIAIGILLYSCTDINNVPNEQKNNYTENSNISLQKSNNDLNENTLFIIAKRLNEFMKTKDNRESIFEMLKKSNNIENIVELNEILETSKLIESFNRTEIDIMRNNKKFNKIDIYCPIISHLEQLDSKNDYYIAIADFNLAKKTKYVYALTKKGDIIKLSTENEPSIPTIVVSFSEKNENYSKNEMHSDKKLKLAGINASDNYTYYFTRMKLDHDYDSGWLGGAMEIYAKILIKDLSTGNIVYTNNKQSIDYNYRKLQDKTYNIPLYSSLSSNYAIKIEIWEEDDFANGGDDLVADGTWARVYNQYGQFIGQNIEYFNWSYSILKLREDYVDPNNNLNYYNYIWIEGRKIVN